MKLNFAFVPYDGSNVEHKVTIYGEKEDLIAVATEISKDNFVTNYYLTDEKSESK